jgi:FtsP/CotA-like multicopper oxidase with cupredoxin domain
MTTTHRHDHVFPTDTGDLPECSASNVVELRDGDAYDLQIAPVVLQLGDARVRMLAYNGSIPGPTLRAAQGAEVVLRVRNDGDHETTVHWHGLRLDNAFDGVPHETQAPIPVGGEFTYRLRFPDDGVYWYHPHVREDYGLEMGLYGNIIVDPPSETAWPAVDREAIVTLDDVLIEDGRVAPFRTTGPTHTAMGRFGNVMFTGGATDLTLQAQAGEVTRLFLTNTANTRLFNLTIPGARMKLVAGDSGRYEREEWIESVLLAPSERFVVDACFAVAGIYPLEHRTPHHTYRLGSIEVADGSAGVSLVHSFERLHTNPELAVERARFEHERQRPPDRTLVFTASMPLLNGEATPGATYVCPMHPDVTSSEPGSCPKCGMRLVATGAPTSYVCPMHPDVTSSEPGSCPKCGMRLVTGDIVSVTSHHDVDTHEHNSSDGLEWEDLMADINARTDESNMLWKLVDADTGAENADIDWRFTVGDRVKIRLVNTMDSDHPMHHPFHIHGAGRFLVLDRDDRAETNLVWKDTVLVPAGQTADILLDVTGPGLWMAHCHIAEHNQDGMMFSFRVDAAASHRLGCLYPQGV